MTTQVTRVTMVKIAEDKIDIALKGFSIFVRDQNKVSLYREVSLQLANISSRRTENHIFSRCKLDEQVGM